VAVHMTEMIFQGKASLWELKPDNGWMIASVTEHCSKRFLFVHCLQGRTLLNGDWMAILFQLAILEECEGVMCEGSRTDMVRALKQFGFRFHEEIYNHWRFEQSGLLPMVKEFSNG